MKAASIVEMVDRLRDRKKAYQSTFLPGTALHDCLADFAKFCGAFDSQDITPDRDLAMLMAGRRQAFFRIYEHLTLEPDELAVLYRAVKIKGENQ
jgi:hypothetical protein